MQATVRDVMSADVVTATRHTSIMDAERILLTHGIDELFVVDPQGLLCGIVPDYELLKWRLTPCPGQRTVETVMTRRFLVIGADSPLTVAGRYLREHVHPRLAVVEGRRLIGQITRRSVLEWLTSLEGSGPSIEKCETSAGSATHRIDDLYPPRPQPRETPRNTALVLPHTSEAISTRPE